ncbi:MAG: metallophosphoesterase [Dysgonamonadaceae bacterium]|nr:metallophosphoesterase [Dysgonamonadaceae bacterium]MDD4727924.1 metallophosphoesterase [Dysgonamonadaceae bacterium]
MHKYILLTLLIFSSTVFPQQALKIVVISDIHYLSSKLATPGVALQNFEITTGRNTKELHAVLDKVIANLHSYQPDVLLITGDITNHGERDSHIDFIAKLKPLTDSGTRIFVVPGNHDVNIPNSKKYVGDTSTPTYNVSAQEFAELYSPYGYGKALKRDTASLSYLAKINENTWILSIDSNRHKEYKTSSISAGKIPPKTLRWTLEILQEAKAKGIKVIAMMHHGLVEHMPYQAVFFSDYLIDDWQKIAETLADNGLKIMFTGHFHSNDITSFTSSKGKTIYDIETGSLAGYPFPYRLITLENNTLNIETEFIKSTPSNPNLKEEYRQKTEQIARRVAKSKIQSMDLPIPSDLKNTLIELVVKMQLLHMKGDEKLDKEMLQMIEQLSELVGGPDADFSTFELDFPPADNFLEIEL